jgi:hypothetical protein
MTTEGPHGCTYSPQPVDTDLIELPEQLDLLIELLAEHNHDLWAQTRIAQGWRYGPRTEPARQLHCNLVPFEDLSDEEQELDRRVVRGVLAAVLAMGFEIRRRD